MALHKIYIGNSQNMETIPSNSIDFIFTDPPFWNQIVYSRDKNQLGNISNYSCYLKELRKVWRECEKVLKPGARMCVLVRDLYKKDEEGKKIKELIPLHADLIQSISSNGFLFQHLIVWDCCLPIKRSYLPVEETPDGQSLKYLAGRLQYILIFKKSGKDKKDIFAEREIEEYWQPIWGFKPLPKVLGSVKLYSFLSKLGNLKIIQTLLLSKKLIQNFRNLLVKDEYKDKDYPVSDPEEVAERMIKLYTQKGDTVLDPFLGTGTTMKVAQKLGRRCIGFEINKNALIIIKKKIHPRDMEIKFLRD